MIASVEWKFLQPRFYAKNKSLVTHITHKDITNIHMVQLVPNYPNTSRGLFKVLAYKNSAGYSHGNSDPTGFGRKWRSIEKKAKSFDIREICSSILHCSSSTSASSASLIQNVALDENFEGYQNLSDEYLITESKWKVRKLNENDSEMRNAVRIQSEAFHEPMAFFDDLFFEFFQAEVLAGLLYKLRNSPPDRYACLVAEPATDDSEFKELVGVADVTVLRDDSVLQHTEGADEYLYISGIAVSNEFRRQKVATVLLKACDVLSRQWGYEYLVLRAYEDDQGARQLYTNSGYRIVSSDPPWTSTWLGKKRRVLMIKRYSYHQRV